MAKFVLDRSEVVPLTRALAEQFAAMKASPTERELNARRVKHLTEKFENGLLLPFNWATATFKGEEIRVNGQHSSHVLTQMNGEFPENGFVHRDHYTVEDNEGLAQLFRQFDDRKSSRNAKDVAGAYQNLFPELQSVPVNIGKRGIEGVAWARKKVEELPTGTGDDIYIMFGKEMYWPFLLWLSTLLSSKTRELEQTEVVAAMWMTFEVDASRAMEFWEKVARGGDEYDEQAPSTVVDRWLQHIKDNHEKLKLGQKYNGCINAWNAYVAEKQLRRINCSVDKGFFHVHS